jgi:hypothetical protein
MKYFACIVILMASSSGFAQKSHKDWKIVTDQNKTCQYAVPRDWTQENEHPSVSNSPDSKMTVVVQRTAPGQSFEDMKKNAQQKMPPLKTLQNSPDRYWFVYRDPADGDDSPDTHWYVAVSRNGRLCTAQITFKSAMGEIVPKQIAATVSPVK